MSSNPKMNAFQASDSSERVTVGLSRRSFLALGGVAAVGGAAVLSGCSPSSQSPSASKASEEQAAVISVPEFMKVPEPITDFIETKEYDVIVVGAGASGLPAALSAREKGASVALLQKESVAVSQGNSGAGILLDSSDPAGVEALVSQLIRSNAHRSNRKLIEAWAYNSGEAVQWVIDKALEGGARVSDTGNSMEGSAVNIDGYELNYVCSFFGPKPYTTGDGMQAFAPVAEKAGVEIFYSTPAVQLVKEGDAVTGVIGQQGNDHIQFIAKKGVILATGDYMNNEEMVEYYVPDIKSFGRKQMNKTGDGHQMGLWVGCQMEPIGHGKMLHDFDAGPYPMGEQPFLAVTDDGKRFVNEVVVLSLMNNYLKTPIPPKDTGGWYSQIFDADYMETAADWGGALVPPSGLENYMPEVEGEKTNIFPDLIRTFKADTLEELADKLEINKAEFIKTVDRYNELCELGNDLDFGKAPKYMKAIKTPPFYGIHRNVRVSALISGLLIDENNQCLDMRNNPIKGLYAVGNVSGCFYGGADYPMDVYGLSLGRCYTQGRLCGQYVAAL